MNKFFKAFNCPGCFFEALGYFTVVVGLVMFIIGVFQACTGLGALSQSGAPDTDMLSSGINGVVLIFTGIITTVVAPQLFFAISKVVKAAEKYLKN